MHAPGRRDGLRAGRGRAIAEDSDGSLWLGTFGGGIQRERSTPDGFHYESVDLAGLDHGHRNVWALHLGPDGTLWAATDAGLLRVARGSLAAREVLQWPDRMQDTLCKAALTMNIGMTSLQDRLASQREPPSAEQRDYIAQHAQRSVDLLKKMGQHDPDWLEAVRDHHRTDAGNLASRSPGQRIARLIQRADIFTARLAPRASRRPDAATAAMQACYFDEHRQIDAAGAALIKAVGVYSPGTLVRMANNETGVVVRRGANTSTPRVAVLVNRDGFATGEHVVRDTSLREFRIIAGVPPHECKVKINLSRLLALTSGPASSRAW